MTTTETSDTSTRRRFREPKWIALFAFCFVATLMVLGVGIVKSSGQAAFDQAAALGDAVTRDPSSLYDKAQITAKAESLGVTVSFSPDFATDGQVIVHSWIPQASVCLYLPSTGAWAMAIGDEPCEPGPRGGPAAVPAEMRPDFGMSDPLPWAEESNPLVAVGRGSQATGYGEVYVQNQGPDEGVAVTITGFTKVTGEPGPKAYFEASAWVRCQPIEGCQYRDVAQGPSGRTPSPEFTPASALIRLPGDTTSVRVAVRQCLDVKLMLGNDVCTDWNFVGPIDVPSDPRPSDDQN